MFADRFDAGTLVPEDSIDWLSRQLAAQLQTPLRERLQAFTLVEHLEIQLVQPIDTPVGQRQKVATASQLLLDVAPSQPAIAYLDRNLDRSGVVLELGDPFLKLPDFRDERQPFGS